MRRTILALALALPLAGCLTAADVQQGAATLQEIVARIRATTVAACGFLPEAQTVSDIVVQGNETVDRVEAVANAICAAVSPLQASAADYRTVQTVTKPTVNGVVVKGKFVKRKK